MDKKTKNVFFDIEMLRRRLIRPYFIELGLTVGQGQPRILKELREHGIMNHKQLLEFLEKKDEKGLEEALKAHLYISMTRMKYAIEVEYKDYFEVVNGSES